MIHELAVFSKAKIIYKHLEQQYKVYKLILNYSHCTIKTCNTEKAMKYYY